MQYKELILRLLPLAREKSEIPCVIWKNRSGWNLDFMNFNVTKEKAAAYFDEIKTRDPCAISIRGADFEANNYLFVRNEVLIRRIYAERDTIPPDSENREELEAKAAFMGDCTLLLSEEEAEYLALCDRPLTAVHDWIPLSLKSNDPEYPYDTEKIHDAINFLKHKIGERIKQPNLGNRDTSTAISDLKQNLYKKELAKIGFPTAEYDTETGKIKIQTDKDRFIEIDKAGEIHFIPADSNIAVNKIDPLVGMVNEVINAWENSRPAPMDYTSRFNILLEYNNIFLVARDDSESGGVLHYAVWNCEEVKGNPALGYHWGHHWGHRTDYYTDNYTDAKENFALRAGLIQTTKVVTHEQAATIKAAIDFSLENCQPLAYAAKFTKINAKLCHAFPDILNAPTERETAMSASEKPAKKSTTLQEKLDNAKQKAATQDSGKSTSGKVKKRDNNNNGRD